MKAKKLPSTFYNPVSLIGSGIALVNFVLILMMMIIEAVSHSPNSYIGILAFIVFPAFLIFGLLLIAYGMWREHRKKVKNLKVATELLKIDFNDPKTLRATYIFVLGTFVLIMFTVFGSIKAYEYTESDPFCGTLCHKVMEPEYTAYQNSPHSKVGCVQCHIGSGAGWFVKSKISGSYQVYSVLFNKYPRPIPTPIENLRPAQETCEQCHWPKHFLSEKRINYNYYISDENNTKTSLSMLMKIGGGDLESANSEGIHWSMNLANDISYVAKDNKREIIPWVQSKSKSGKVTIYRSTEEKISDSEITSEKIRKFDCIDCHNRPSHIYHMPDKMVNTYLGSGSIDATLPYIKSLAVKSLEGEYNSEEQALDKINSDITQFYNLNYAEVSKTKKNEISKSISAIQRIYKTNYFPFMKVSWRKFPINIGHMTSNGCFRCHDGKHISDDGKIIPNDCNVCHTIIQQVNQDGKVETSLAGLDFVHPIDVGIPVSKENCVTCHIIER